VRGTLCAFVLTRSGLRVYRSLAALETVEAASRRLRYQLQKMEMGQDYVKRHGERLQASAEEALGQLYDLLLRPLETHLATPKITLIPYGALHGLPFHAFFDGTGYAVDRWEFAYAPSAAVWNAGSRRRQKRGPVFPVAETRDSALLMSVPAPGIERVTEEVRALSKLLLGARLYHREQATVERFRENAACCAIIHLATHGMFRADNPLFSGLRFADGWLLARDLYGMQLDCDLATLSACHTGVAQIEPGDELFGLLRGFLGAGVRAVAASLWPAEDAATTALMIEFYHRLSRGASKAKALQQAQQETRRRYPHPYYWAAFVLVGER
jgi:CHAT domain-containing protein